LELIRHSLSQSQGFAKNQIGILVARQCSLGLLCFQSAFKQAEQAFPMPLCRFGVVHASSLGKYKAMFDFGIPLNSVIGLGHDQ